MNPINPIKEENKMNELTKQQSEMSLVERMKAKRVNNEIVLLLDTSGSMSTSIEPDLNILISRIDALRNIVKSLHENPTCYSFNDFIVRLSSKNEIPDPSGQTYMSHAFSFLKQQGIKDIILITDGAATDPFEALEEAKGLNIRIMYVGSDPRPSFLDELAKVAGGQIITSEDLKKPKELTSKIQLLLSSGDETKKGTICL